MFPTIPSKYLWPLLIVLGIIGAVIFYDRIMEIILGLFGLGAVAEGAKRKADKALAVAVDADERSDADKKEAAQHADASRELLDDGTRYHELAEDDAEDITPVDRTNEELENAFRTRSQRKPR